MAITIRIGADSWLWKDDGLCVHNLYSNDMHNYSYRQLDCVYSFVPASIHPVQNELNTANAFDNANICVRACHHQTLSKFLFPKVTVHIKRNYNFSRGNFADPLENFVSDTRALDVPVPSVIPPNNLVRPFINRFVFRNFCFCIKNAIC